MKSKRAEELISIMCWRDPHDKEHLTKAVELAEEDARERAIKAVCGSCIENKRPKKCLAIRPENCLRLSGFKKNYDNF